MTDTVTFLTPVTMIGNVQLEPSTSSVQTISSDDSVPVQNVLIVNGNTTIQGKLDVSSTINANDLIIANNLDVDTMNITSKLNTQDLTVSTLATFTDLVAVTVATDTVNCDALTVEGILMQIISMCRMEYKLIM